MTGTDLQEELDRVGVDRFTSPDYGIGEVVHVVLFRFRAGVDPERVAEVDSRFRALTAVERNGTPLIRSLRGGPQLSGEGIGGGYELGYVLTFASLGDRNHYDGAPVVLDPRFADREHARFKDFVGPLLAEPGGALVFDLQDPSAR